MEVVLESVEEKQSFEKYEWSESKETTGPETDEDSRMAHIYKIYGPGINLSMSKDQSSFALTVEEERCTLSDSMLSQFLPEKSYAALCQVNTQAFQPDQQEKFSECEKLLREAFHEGNEIPRECQSILTTLIMPTQEREEDTLRRSKRVRDKFAAGTF
jgi:hypothetical protein